jgi:hypothetical protein
LKPTAFRTSPSVTLVSGATAASLEADRVQNVAKRHTGEWRKRSEPRKRQTLVSHVVLARRERNEMARIDARLVLAEVMNVEISETAEPKPRAGHVPMHPDSEPEELEHGVAPVELRLPHQTLPLRLAVDRDVGSDHDRPRRHEKGVQFRPCRLRGSFVGDRGVGVLCSPFQPLHFPRGRVIPEGGAN